MEGATSSDDKTPNDKSLQYNNPHITLKYETEKV